MEMYQVKSPKMYVLGDSPDPENMEYTPMTLARRTSAKEMMSSHQAVQAAGWARRHQPIHGRRAPVQGDRSGPGW